MVIAPQQREGDPASTELAVQTFAHSLVIARVSIPFGFFLSPNLLEVLADAIEGTINFTRRGRGKDRSVSDTPWVF